MQYFKDIGSFVNGKQIFVGIDVHVKNWVVCVVCDGEVVERVHIAASYAPLQNFLKKYVVARKISCVYEAGFSGFWLCRRLRADGYSCLVTPPGKVPKTETKVKTDKRDAEKLAFYLSAGLLKKVWLPPEGLEADRRIVRRRSQVVKMQSRAKHHIRSFLHLREIVRPPSVKSNWSKKYIAWLEGLHFAHESDNFTFAQLLKAYRRQRNDLAELTLYLRQLSKSNRYEKNFRLLASVRGVGLITGMTFLLEIFDFGRFQNTRQFGSYLGLTPSQYSSGENVRLGHITRFGNANLRRVLVRERLDSDSPLPASAREIRPASISRHQWQKGDCCCCQKSGDSPAPRSARWHGLCARRRIENSIFITDEPRFVCACRRTEKRATASHS